MSFLGQNSGQRRRFVFLHKGSIRPTWRLQLLGLNISPSVSGIFSSPARFKERETGFVERRRRWLYFWIEGKGHRRKSTTHIYDFFYTLLAYPSTTSNQPSPHPHRITLHPVTQPPCQPHPPPPNVQPQPRPQLQPNPQSPSPSAAAASAASPSPSASSAATRT